VEFPDVKVFVLTHIDQVAKFWDWLTRPGREFLAMDIEATGLDWSAPGFRVRMIQVGDENSGWAIPFQDWRGLVQGMFDFVERARIDLVWHNVGYDSMGLRREGITLDWSLVKDTFALAALGGYCEEPRGLKENAVRELGPWAGLGQVVLKRGMATQGWTWETVPLGWRPYPLYGVVDVIVTARLWRKWQPRYLKWQEMHDLEVSAMRITGNMSWHGLPVDIGYLDGKIAEVAAEEQGIVERLKAKYGLNPSQPAAVVKVLTELDLFGPDPVLTPTGKKSVDEVALGRINHEISRDVIRWRGLHGTRIKYLTKLRDKADADGLVHPGIKSMEAKTGRMSIEDPPMQQLPDDDMVRKAIIGRGEDHQVISCDWSQIELRIWASINGDAPLIQAIKDADNSVPKVDFFTSLCRSLYQEPGFVKGDHRRTKVKSCVPLDTEILTRRGWLTYDQVRVGDLTLGYDHKTGRSTWTPVTAVHIYDDGDVHRLHNSFFSARCTLNHRWVTADGFAFTEDIPGSHHYDHNILSAPAQDGDLPLSPDEAALLGWVLTDGSLTRSKFTGKTAQGGDGRRRGIVMRIYQKKLSGIADITGLLTRLSVPYTTYRSREQTVFNMRADYARDLVRRAEIDTKKNFDPWQLATGLTEQARRGMIRTMLLADGLGDGSSIAKTGSVAELFLALGYLTGHLPRVTVRQPNGKGWQKQPIEVIRHGKRTFFTGNRTTLEQVGIQPVWCVSTGLGSWTMRQGRTPMLTGNSFYAKMFTGGIEVAAATAGVTISEMVPTWRTLGSAFESLADLGRKLVQTGKVNGQQVWWIDSPFGRRFAARDKRAIRVVPNYVVQGTAAIALKKALVVMDALGIGDYLMLPVHDEVLASAPKDETDDVQAVIADAMNSILTEEEWGIGVPAEPHSGITWAEAKAG
jgi:DNA polymerase I-like protein with 3'-5' exonuclease and polymerase domains